MKMEESIIPTAEDVKRIDQITIEPDHYNLSGDEEIFLWKFRYTLVKRQDMLVKFLLATQWKS